MRCANPQSRHCLRDPIVAQVSSVPPRILQLAASSQKPPSHRLLRRPCVARLRMQFALLSSDCAKLPTHGLGTAALRHLRLHSVSALWQPAQDFAQPASLPGRPGEFHSEPPTDPDVNLSIHPARATQRRLPPSIKTRSSSGFPLTPPRRGWPAPFAPRELPRFLTITRQCAPGQCIGTFGLVGSPLVPFPFASPTRFSSSVRKPR